MGASVRVEYKQCGTVKTDILCEGQSFASVGSSASLCACNLCRRLDCDAWQHAAGMHDVTRMYFTNLQQVYRKML